MHMDSQLAVCCPCYGSIHLATYSFKPRGTNIPAQSCLIMHAHTAKHQANDSVLPSLLQVQHSMQNLNNNWMVRYISMETLHNTSGVTAEF